ncbi:hypothetical protein M758_4G199600 [Ceratodon purpureus]|nr:hypothetical protein M758_4G199600 [Ceratodon purpureus]
MQGSDCRRHSSLLPGTVTMAVRIMQAARAVLLAAVVVAMCSSVTDGAVTPLKIGFYGTTCPQAEQIIFDTMLRIFNTPIDPLNPEIGPNVAPDLLRLHFHDCFVDGCDGSVLLDGPTSEKAAAPNVRLEGFIVVDQIKAALEAACPQTVSCADILAFAARDALKLTGGFGYDVPAGRRDGLTSSGAGAVSNLPNPTESMSQLSAKFAKFGLTQADMVVLSGAHTIGDVACHHIDNRLYTFRSRTGSDPSLPLPFLLQLKAICPSPGLQLITVSMDQVTPLTFDSQYYRNLQTRRSVLSSDQLLFTDARTRPIVNQLAKSNTVFFRAFAKAMVKMGNIGNLRGTDGQVRTDCKIVNAPVAA